MSQPYTDTYLDSMRTVGDPLCDGMIARLVEQGGYRALEQLLLSLRDWLTPPPPDAPDEIRAFFDEGFALPAWVEPAKIKAAEDLFAAFGPAELVLILLWGVPRFFTNEIGARTFLQAKLFNKDVIRTRMIEVPQMVFYICQTGGLSPAPKKGNGILAVQKLRMIHSIVRVFLGRNWDQASWGVPICQEDLAMATASFSLSTIDGLPKLGIDISPSEQEGLYTAWKTFGYVLGVREELLPQTIDEARVLLAICEERRSRSSPINHELTAELIATAQGFLPSFMKNVPAGLIRYLAGDEAADRLGIEKHDIAHFIEVLEFVGRHVDNDDGRTVFRWISHHVAPHLVKWLAGVERRDARGKLDVPSELREKWGIDIN